jgi:DUF4097 and DUF4098 domain-containing protein YvlB
MNDTRPYYRRRSVFAPLLVAGIGVVLLLCNLGKVSCHDVGVWFSHYWPLLLIFWGIVKFAEYLWARHRNEPYSGVGGAGVVFLIVFGLLATGATHVDWDWFDTDSDWIFGNHYDFTENFAIPMPIGREVRVLSGHGDITITPSPDDQAHVFVHKYIRGSSQDEANQFNTATHPKFEQQGTVWLLDMTGGSFTRGRFNLEIQVPAKYSISLLDRQGDIRVSQMQADVDLETNHGDINIEQIKGNATLHAHRGDVKAQNVSGNVNVDGSVNDAAFGDIGGTLTLNGSYTGDVSMSHVAGQVKFTTSRTDLQIAKVDGDLALDRGDVKGSSVVGPLSLRTDAKDVRLERVTGDIHIDNRRGSIDVDTIAPLGKVEITTTGEEIIIALPENGGFQVDAESNGGRIQSDFNLNVNNDRSIATAIGTVGNGGPLVKLRTNHGTIQIRKE